MQLTQWENFKCKFPESLPKDIKDTWDEKMEELSNNYFTCSGEQHKLPDNAFFALYARVMSYEARKSAVKDCGNEFRIAKVAGISVVKESA